MSIFGGNTGVTYEQLQARRKIAENLRQGMGGTPRNIGEGVHAIAKAISAKAWEKQNQKDEAKLQSDFDTQFSQLTGSFGPSTMTQATVPASGGMEQYRNAIASIESAGSGDYQAIGPTNPKLGRALGRYQIMEANIGPWSREALGREVTPDEFLANPQLQDAIFDHKFGGYVQQFGPEGAAQAWFAGPGGVGKMDRKDVLGTTVGDYTQKFSKAVGGPSGGAGGQNMQLITQLAGLASNPMASPAQKAIVETLLQRQMQTGDPMYQMQMERERLELDRLQNPPAPERKVIKGADGFNYYQDTGERVLPNVVAGGTGQTEYGLNPQYVTDAEGNLGMVVLGKDGTAKTVEMPEGMALQKGVEKLDLGTAFQWYNTVTGEPIGQPIPKDNRGAARETAMGSAEGKSTAEGISAAPQAIAQAQDAISLIDSIMVDPALPSITGMVQGRLPPMTQAGTDLSVKIEQLQGKAFLDAFESLKGGGAITEREGQAAQNAMARLQRAQSDTAYKEALTELRGIMQRGMERAQGRLGGQPAAVAAGDIPPPPEGFDPARWPDIWAAMTPEDKRLWE